MAPSVDDASSPSTFDDAVTENNLQVPFSLSILFFSFHFLNHHFILFLFGSQEKEEFAVKKKKKKNA